MPETVTVTSDFAAAPISLWRRGVNAFATFAAGAAVVLVLLPLGAVFGYLIYKGIGSINWERRSCTSPMKVCWSSFLLE